MSVGPLITRAVAPIWNERRQVDRRGDCSMGAVLALVIGVAIVVGQLLHLADVSEIDRDHHRRRPSFFSVWLNDNDNSNPMPIKLERMV